MDIIRRSAWSAVPSRGPATRVTWGPDKPLWVHYSAGDPPPDDRAAEAATVQAIQRFHMGPSRGWNDIGYSYLVAPSGRVYEGRGWGVMGAHSPGNNSAPSVCLLWRSDNELPPQAALDSVLRLREFLEAGPLRAHREGTPTGCPGAAIYAWVVTHRTAKPSTTRSPFAPPWGVYAGGRQIGAGKLTDPVLIYRISRALRAAGHRPPYTARLKGGQVIGHGKFWPPGDFTKVLSGHLRLGRDVEVNKTVTITTRKA